MRIRFLAFLPVAGVITLFLLVATSSWVSAIERSVTGEAEPAPIQVRPFETECEGLFRELHALSHEVTTCSPQATCAGSPLRCPSALDVRMDREFERLRSALAERCGYPLGLMDYAWGGPVREALPCGATHDWMEAASSGEARPSLFLF